MGKLGRNSERLAILPGHLVCTLMELASGSFPMLSGGVPFEPVMTGCGLRSRVMHNSLWPRHGHHPPDVCNTLNASQGDGQVEQLESTR